MSIFDIYLNLDIFILIILRISGFIFTSPVLGRKEIPSITKIAISIFLAYILIMTGVPTMAIVPKGIGQYVLLCFNETIRGMLLGFISSIFFSIFPTTGKIIDTQIGFHLGGVLDPRYNTKSTISGNIINIAAFIIFLSLNGHLNMIKILSDLYATIPVGQALDIAGLSDLFLQAFSLSFLIAVKLALPVIMIILITEAIMGMLIKFIPQMNIFVVGIPLKILIGIFSLFFLITPLVGVLDTVFESIYNFAYSLT